LSMLGFSMERSAIVVLAYRGFSFWMPLLVGVGALRWVRGLGRRSAQLEDDLRPAVAHEAGGEAQPLLLERPTSRR
jgi:hypothetical protein